MILLPGRALGTEFFQAQVDHSLNAIFGIPTPLAGTLAHGQSRFGVSGTYANQFSGGNAEQESLQLDGERAELRLSWFQSLNSCYNWGAELPLIAHGSGYFDRFIESWHELFGLPNGGREQTEQDLLLIDYQDTDGQRLTMQSSSASAGDMHIQLVRHLGCGNNPGNRSSASARLGLKLPTGDTSLLSGSGAFDAYIDVTSGDLAAAEKLGFRVSAGLIALGSTSVVSNEEQWAVYGSTVLGWHYSPGLELVSQLDWHSRLFTSELRELGSVALQLTVGGRFHLRSGAALDVAFLEDVAPDTAPDISLHMGYRRTF